MRILALGLLIGCGAPAFVPVTVTLSDPYGSGLVFGTATKKLNPSCTANCELGVAIEDGGCTDLVLFNDGGQQCTPGGGSYAAVREALRDGGVVSGPVKMIAPGSELKLEAFSVPPADPSCTKTFTVPASSFTIATVRDANGACAFSTQP